MEHDDGADPHYISSIVRSKVPLCCPSRTAALSANCQDVLGVYVNKRDLILQENRTVYVDRASPRTTTLRGHENLTAVAAGTGGVVFDTIVVLADVPRFHSVVCSKFVIFRISFSRE